MVAEASSCFFCGRRGRAGTQCATCFVAMPDPNAPEPPVHPTCPRCHGGLRRVPMDRGAQLHACAECGGIFVGARAWCMFLDRPELVRAIERRLPTRAPRTGGALVPLVGCASCGAQMDRGRFAASSGVVVDVCPRHGVWLDDGELGRVAAFALSPSRPGDAPSVHPALAAAEQERRRIEAIGIATPRKPPRPLWMKLVPLLLFGLVVAVRWYYVSKLAREAGVTEEGEFVRKAGQEGTKALGAGP